VSPTPANDAIEPILTMQPRVSRSAGSSAWVTLTRPLRLVSMMRFPVVQVGVVRRLRRQRQPGVVNQRFDIGKGGGQLCHRGGNGLAVTHVQLDNMYRHQQAQPVIQFLQARQAAAAQHQRPARFGKHLCRCLPKTGGGPGNKHYVVGGHFTLLCALLPSL